MVHGRVMSLCAFFFSPTQGPSYNRATSKCSKYTLASHPIFDFRFWGGKSGNSRLSSNNQYPQQSSQATTTRKSKAQASCQPWTAPTPVFALGKWTRPEPDRQSSPTRPPHPACPSSSSCHRVLLRARGSCESRVSDPSHAAQGDPAKCAVDEVGDRKSGLILPVAAPEAPRADRSLLSAIRHELFNAGGETSY